MLKKILMFVFVFFFLFTFSLNSRADGFKINFNNVDIKVFLDFMSQQLNKNFIIDNSVRVNITIISPEEIPNSQAEMVFLTVLDVYGYTAIPRGSVTAIVPLAGVKEKGLEVIIEKNKDNLKKLGEKYVIHLIPLTYCNANNLVTLFSPFVSKTGNLSADERTNILIIADRASNVVQLAKIVAALDLESPPGQENLHIYKLENADSEELAKVLTAVATARATQQRIAPRRQITRGRTTATARSTASTKVIVPSSIVADKSSNSLIITATPEEYITLKKIIEKLDILQSQVFIEALIAEVSEGLITELGIKWEDEAMRQNLFGLAIGSIKGAVDLPITIGSLINLYGNNSNFRILSTPQIQCVNNQEATINVGQNIPYLKQSRISEEETVINTYDYKDVGVLLKILPQISTKSKMVKLKITQQLTELVGDLTERPTTAVRSTETTVVVADRHTIIISGLIRETENKVIHKVPLLGDIPLIGLIFRRESFRKERTNLLIFITPYVISSPQDAEKMKKEKEKVFKNATGENK